MDSLAPLVNPGQARISWFSGIFWTLAEYANAVLFFVGLKSARKFWGVVYDSVTKQPLDPVIVKLAYVDSGSVVETVVTDLEGRYGFLARPGKFKIFAQKTHYQFPSSRITGYSDGPYEDVYHGEFFDLSEDDEVVAPSIPMDPLQADWNQQEKNREYATYPYRTYFLRRLGAAFFWFGFVLTICFLIWQRSLGVYIFAGVFCFLLILSQVTPHTRLWGKVVDAKTGEGRGDIALELVVPHLNNMVLAKTKTIETGKYFLRANSGTYSLHVKKLFPGNLPPVLLAVVPVHISRQRILNKTIIIHEKTQD